MVESETLHAFVKVDDAPIRQTFSKPKDVRPRAPINPIPAMIIFLLGLILAGHHQTNMESAMMHNHVLMPASFHTHLCSLANEHRSATFSLEPLQLAASPTYSLTSRLQFQYIHPDHILNLSARSV